MRENFRWRNGERWRDSVGEWDVERHKNGEAGKKDWNGKWEANGVLKRNGERASNGERRLGLQKNKSDWKIETVGENQINEVRWDQIRKGREMQVVSKMDWKGQDTKTWRWRDPERREIGRQRKPLKATSLGKGNQEIVRDTMIEKLVDPENLKGTLREWTPWKTWGCSVGPT